MLPESTGSVRQTGPAAAPGAMPGVPDSCVRTLRLYCTKRYQSTMKNVIKKGDLVLAVIFIACALLIAFSVQIKSAVAAGTASGDGETTVRLMVQIEIDGGEYMTVPLDEDQVITISNEYGTNVITIEDGAVCVTEADCGNQVCVYTGAIRDAGRMIVCLPHLLSVEIVTADGSETEYDAIAY